MKQTSTQDAALLSRARRLLSDHRTRAKKAGVELNYTLRDLAELLASSQACAYCGCALAWDMQMDHKQPIARGGRFTLDNLTPACGRCNRLKSILTESEMGELLTFLNLLPIIARQDLERRLLAGGSSCCTRFSGTRRNSWPKRPAAGGPYSPRPCAKEWP
jgi:5-methylcytosine-specific restriction endonuclease McrA